MVADERRVKAIMEDVQQFLAAAAVAQRPLRERVGVWVEAKNVRDIVTRIRAAEEAGVQQIWSQSVGFADILTAFAAATTHQENIM